MLTKPTPSSKSTAASHKQGVIAVLFLFVVAIVIGAISLSMQTGLIVEKRIHADQATDASAFAMASKSAQGLNFIAANNLAIASSSHMVGALHIMADWTMLYYSFFHARTAFNASDYKKFYEVLQPVAKVYMRSGTGLTRLNTAIKNVYPYLAVVDAGVVGGANSPGMVLIPFRAPEYAQNPQKSSGSVNQDIKANLTDQLKNMLPKYDGLTQINSDETFCLAYLAGEQALGPKWHKFSNWLDPSAFEPIGMDGVIGVMKGITKITEILEWMLSFATIRVGFHGCGFGETGEAASGSSSMDKSMIIGLFASVLKGPLSGRPIKITTGTDGLPVYLTPTKDLEALAQEVNSIYAKSCTPTIDYGLWNTKEIKTIFNPSLGVCVYPKVDGPSAFPTYQYSAENNRLIKRVSTIPTTQQAPGMINLKDYQHACYGTVLFKWSGYSGLLTDPAFPPNTDPPVHIASPETHPLVGEKDLDSSLCPPFQVTPEGQEPYFYPNNGIRQQPSDPIGLSRAKPLTKEIIERLSFKEFNQDPPNWRGGNPRQGAFSEISEYLACASGSTGTCPFNDEDGKGGYFKNVQGQRFYPKIQALNWLCPANPPNEINNAAFISMLSFDSFFVQQDPLNPIVIDRHSVNQYQSRINGSSLMGGWHNERVRQLSAGMKCQEYQDFVSADRAPPEKRTTPPQGDTNSHDFCAPGAHMCWQRTLQNKLGTQKLNEGNLSFTVIKKPSEASKTDLDTSLNYAVLSLSSLRTDNGRDLVGRQDGSDLNHCPIDMEINATLSDGTTVEICDVQPIVGFMSQMFQKNTEEAEASKRTPFGFGDTNLASGGSIDGLSELSLKGFMGVAQARVVYEEKLPGDPNRPDPKDNPKPSTAQNYRMFWPSWKPILVPARVFSKLLPEAVTPLIED